MSRMVNSIDSSQQMVSTLQIRERRKTAGELARMSLEGRILYDASHPKSEAEKYEALEHEMAWADYASTGEVDPQIILANDPPPEWGN